jgi:uncharacterized membrane protein
MFSTRTTTGRVSSVAAAMIAAAVLVAGATAPAYAADPDADAPKAAAKVEKEKKYCVVDTLTGSRVQKKICRTRAEWIARTGSSPADAK